MILKDLQDARGLLQQIIADIPQKPKPPEPTRQSYPQYLQHQGYGGHGHQPYNHWNQGYPGYPAPSPTYGNQNYLGYGGGGWNQGNQGSHWNRPEARVGERAGTPPLGSLDRQTSSAARSEVSSTEPSAMAERPGVKNQSQIVSLINEQKYADAMLIAMHDDMAGTAKDDCHSLLFSLEFAAGTTDPEQWMRTSGVGVGQELAVAIALTLVRAAKELSARGELGAAHSPVLTQLRWSTAIMQAMSNTGSQAISQGAQAVVEAVKGLMKMGAIQASRPAMVRCGEALNAATNAM